jgi:Tfp pilus assembly protein PilO
MKLGQRDKRALAGLAVAGVALAVFLRVSGGGGEPAAVRATGTIESAERRLARVRRVAATLDGKRQVLKQVTDELALREKGIIQAQTAPQAQAQLLDIVRRVARAQTPRPLEFGGVELQQPAKFGDYGEVRIAIQFTCQIEDLVNFLADLTQQPEAIATTDLRIGAQDQKKKTISIRLTVSGVVPRRLVPEKKGFAAF